MSRDSDDPFDLRDKNLKRVVPQVRKNIKIQRTRVIVHIVTFLFCLTAGLLGLRSSGICLGVGCVLLFISPFFVVGVIADHHLMRWHRRRLAECRRRLNEDRPP